MRLYYTNISTNGGVQTRPDLSLGGFISSSVVSNDRYKNLFSDVSCYSVQENKDEYIGLALLNETGADVQNVTFYFTYPEQRQKDIEIAFVSFNANDEMEIIPNSYSAPYNATFNAADGELNAITIGTIAADEKVGIWFKKILNIDNITEEYSNESLEENGNPEEADEDIILVYYWNFAVVTTDDVANVAQTTADCGGEVTDDSSLAVTERGVCWSTEELPTIADDRTSDGSGLGVFTSAITGLTAETTYYLRSYATNSEGTAYGEQKTFTTLV
jgi:hypothetical protein